MQPPRRQSDVKVKTVAHFLDIAFPQVMTDMQGIIHAQKDGWQHRSIISNQTAHYMDLSADGGPCPNCDKQYKRIDVKNRFADFHYFDPDCGCSPHCPDCGVSLHVEHSQWGFGMQCGCGYGRDKQEQVNA
jgi:hypothetical protein